MLGIFFIYSAGVFASFLSFFAIADREKWQVGPIGILTASLLWPIIGFLVMLRAVWPEEE